MKNWSEQISNGAVLLTVNQRLSRHHVHQYQQWQMRRGHSWWETPSILPLGSWMSKTHQMAVSMGLSDSVLIPKMLVDRQWQRIVNSDKSVQLLDPMGAARQALQAWELSCVWQCANDEDRYLSMDQRTWQRWMGRYRNWLRDERAIDEALLPSELINIMQQATAGQLKELLPETLILDGFLELPNQLQQLVACIESNGTQINMHKPVANAELHKQKFEDDESELRGIAAQVRTLLEDDPGKRLGVVIPDLQQRRDAVIRAFENVFYPLLTPKEIAGKRAVYEVSLGNPLADQAVISAALLMLRLSATSIRDSEISHLVLSPYWTKAAAEARGREQLDRRLRDDRIRALSLQQFEEQLFKSYRTSELVPAVKAVLKKRKLTPATLSEWAARFSQWLKLLGWPGQGLESAQYQAVSGWYECLDDMQLIDDGEKLDCQRAVTTIQTLARERIFQIETPATPITVMGRLESHGLGFDCLWIAGLDNEKWPPVGSPSAFLQIDAQKRCAIPAATAAGRLALAETELLQWASQAPLLIGSSVLNQEGKPVVAAQLPVVTPSAENDLISARLLAMIEAVGDPVDPISVLSNALSLESLVDENGPALDQHASAGGGASLFENQAKCPFRAFSLHRLNVRPLEEVGLGLDAREHGNLLHKALELFWVEHVSHTALMLLDDEALHAAIEKAVLLAIDECGVPEHLRQLELTRLSDLLSEWMNRWEKPREPFSVVAQERRQAIEYAGIAMNVVVDRIDDVEGTRVIVDYKTGVSNTANTWEETRIPNPQLPLYALSLEEISGVSFAQVANNKCKYIGLTEESGTLPGVGTRLRKVNDSKLTGEELSSWSAWRAHWKAALDAIADEVKSGTATVTPLPTACQFCELKSLCRVDSNSAADGDDQATTENETRYGAGS